MKGVNPKYLLASVSLSIVFVMALAPGNVASQVDDKFYGQAEMVFYNNQGDEVLTQTVHNTLVDSGETYLIKQTFYTSDSPSSNSESIGSICLTNASPVETGETETATDFDGDSTLTTAACLEPASGGTITNSGGTAVIGPINFEAGTGDQVPGGTVITGIGVCQSIAATNDTGVATCGATVGSGGILFAVVDTTDVTLAAGETVDITYTFDIASPSN